jgi:hypothetical protein
MEALQAPGTRLATDPARELRPQSALLFVAAVETHPQRLVLLRATAPALDAALGLEPRDRSA